MKMQTKDRRTQRTDKMLREALIELIQTKPYDAITIRDILERANIGRSTFYAHYFDKEDLLAAVLQDLLHGLGQQLAQKQQNDGALFPSLPFFRHVQERHDLYEALACGRGLETVEKNLRVYLIQQIQGQLEAQTPVGIRPEISPNLLATFVANTFLTVLRWWLDKKMPYTAERVEEIFRELAHPGMEAIRRRSLRY